MGATGTGKSETALLLAEQVGGEIIGCDALQVYVGFDVATSKPSLEDRARVPHHLVDVADPREDFNLARFVGLADAAIADIAERGRVPVLVGGTGLYLRGLLRGIVRAPARDPGVRKRLQALAVRHGPARLHRWLQSVDADSARRLSPADTQRIVRALEVVLISGSTWSETLRRDGTWSRASERYACLKIGLDLDREALDRRIEARVDRYFRSGLVREVRELLGREIPEEANAFKAIGYREVLASLRNDLDPERARGEIVRNTRQYAKRQRTWFRREPGIVWLDAAPGPLAVAGRIATLWAAWRARSDGSV